MEVNNRPDFDTAFRELACKNRHVSKLSANRASAIGAPNECLRKLTYMRTDWDKCKQPDDFLMGIFQTGNEVEEITIRNLIDIGRHNGFRVIETQKTLEWPEYQIVGHCDGIIQVDDKTIAGLEIKSVGARFDSLKDIDSLMSWDIAAKWFGQSQTYMLLESIPLWALILVQKNNLYNTRTIWLELDLEYAEMIVQRAEVINAHIKAGTFPDQINDPRLCLRCPFAHICMPDLQGLDNSHVIDDDDVAAAITRMGELKEAKQEYDRCEKKANEVKAFLPEATVDTVSVAHLLHVGEHLLHYVGSKRTTQPSAGGTSFYWRKKAAK